MNHVTSISKKRYTDSNALIVRAFEQSESGKSACTNPVRGILYNKNVNQKVYIDVKKEDLYQDQVIELHYNDSIQYAFIKEIQKHPVNEKLIHVDLFTPDASYETVVAKLPINFVDQDKSEGLKRGGFLYITSRSLPVRMKYNAIVPFLNVSVEGMNGGEHVRSTSITMPEGIQNLRPDLTIATLIGSKAAS